MSKKLQELMIRKRIEPDEMVVRCGVCVATIYRILAGYPMYRKTARKIEIGTKGEVAIEDLIYDRNEPGKLY